MMSALDVNPCIYYRCNEHGPQRLLTIRCADWSVQVTLSIAEEAVN